MTLDRYNELCDAIEAANVTPVDMALYEAAALAIIELRDAGCSVSIHPGTMICTIIPPNDLRLQVRGTLH